ncbi:MAG: hypothetical protein HKO59_11410 [Phycisphaerales bacterium]|nr:hypothetical protein [Phycisphaerae bacterium]NNF42813.1 hypothetical protein [Phycisphaerales bacterium]NNM26570.1 hypothetical protein [Phycisphaerales bacterium]
MPALSRTQLALPVTLLLTLAVALLPVGWRYGWQRELSELVRFPLTPFTHAGNLLASWLRPVPSEGEGMPIEIRERLEQLAEETNRAIALYQNERNRSLELEEQLRQLQMIPAHTLQVATGSAVAHVTARHPDSATGVVRLKLARGHDRDIPVGTIAVYGGAHVLGRVAGEPTRSEVDLLPIVHTESGLVQGRVLPGATPMTPIDDGVLVQLAPTGRGTLTADIDRAIVVQEGDVVRLQDRSWPATAQGLLVGTVRSITVDEAEPLRYTLEIAPTYQVQQVAYATLVIEAIEDRGGSGGAGDTP